MAPELGAGGGAQIAAGDQELAVGRAVEPGERPQERRLSAARRADDGREPPGLELEVDRAERLDRAARRDVGLRERAAGGERAQATRSASLMSVRRAARLTRASRRDGDDDERGALASDGARAGPRASAPAGRWRAGRRAPTIGAADRIATDAADEAGEERDHAELERERRDLGARASAPCAPRVRGDRLCALARLEVEHEPDQHQHAGRERDQPHVGERALCEHDVRVLAELRRSSR